MKTAICTIVAKNYLPQARVLMDSVRRWNPEAMRIVVLVDEVDGFFDPRQEDFETILSKDLPIPSSKWFHFKYVILELSTAVKPYALEFLMRRYDLTRIVYLDPDIQVFSSLANLFAGHPSSAIFLTPHLTAPNRDDLQPGDLEILRAGTYNLGFIGLRASEETFHFLRWWQSKLYDLCVVDLPRGLFVDQRWVDLVPGLFSGVAILREAGYNVAYWNLSHRQVRRAGDQYTVNGEPLYFFHYSGFDPANPETVSKHQNRYQLSDVGEARRLFLDYRDALMKNGYLECQQWPYAYGFFTNGERIPDIGRPVHHESPSVLTEAGDPFSESGFRVFVDIWNQPAASWMGQQSGISRMAYRIYRIRPDVQAVMPDIFGADRIRFLEWLLSTGKSEHALNARFLTPAQDALDAANRQKDNQAPAGAGEASNGDSAAVEEEGQSNLTEGARRIYESRKDLQRHFSDPFGKDGLDYLEWLLTYGKSEYKLSGSMLDPLRKQWDGMVGRLPGHSARVWRRFRLAGMTLSARGPGKMEGWRAAYRTFPGRTELKTARSLPPASPRVAAARLVPKVFGLHVIGYLRAESGVGEGARSSVRSARAVQLPTSIQNVIPNAPCRNDDDTVRSDSSGPGYQFSLFHINADMTPEVFAASGNGTGASQFNIGYWAWELEEFPDRWASSFDYYREIWTLSTFCQRAISQNSPVPVICVPLSLEVSIPRNHSRADFGIPDGPFVFLAVFDVLSVVERKNPVGAIEAFIRAFAGNPQYHLILKVNNGPSKPREMAILRNRASGYPVTIIDRTLSREETNGLINVADSLVSLHRSEGFGLTLAEAMYLGKPVIATGYSGNMDFTKPDNSLLVDYRLIPVGPHQDPYDAKCLWADPDVEHAANHMRDLATNSELYSRLSREGETFVRTQLCPAAIGARIKERLHVVRSQMNGAATK